jgi:hypothetical protein
MKHRIAIALAAVAASAGLGAAPAPSATASVPVGIARSCSPGYTHAVIGGAEKCLHSGQFCAHRYDTQYRRYGYRCTRYYTDVDRYRLTRR